MLTDRGSSQPGRYARPVSERSAEHRGSAYSSAGVDYEALDAGKRSALTEAMATSGLLGALGGRAVDESRGERAFGFVVEGLGTKSIIARQVEAQLGVGAFDNVAYDTVAAIVNDLCCVGALPLVVNAYFATGSSEWYRQEDRHAALLTGWREACEDAGAAWGGGESPSLPELVHAPDIELAGSAVGLVPDGRPAILGGELAPGDEIVLVESNGLHANGSSLARLIASRLPDGYRTKLPSGRTFGEALLDRSAIYVGLVRELLAARVEIHYLSHITGHGLLKLMRPRRELTYRIRALPDVPEVLGFLVEQADMSRSAAYSTFNMGCGFAVYCAQGSGNEVVAAASRLGLGARVAGVVEEGPRRVVLEEVGVTFESGDMDLGPGGRDQGSGAE
jgi:phosphoribosylformylglycinamidine cyclo-ligase